MFGSLGSADRKSGMGLVGLPGMKWIGESVGSIGKIKSDSRIKVDESVGSGEENVEVSKCCTGMNSGSLG